MATIREARSGAGTGTGESLTSAAHQHNTPPLTSARPVPPSPRPYQHASRTDLEQRACHWHQAALLAVIRGDAEGAADAQWHLRLVQDEQRYRVARRAWLRLERERRAKAAMAQLLAQRKAARS